MKTETAITAPNTTRPTFLTQPPLQFLVMDAPRQTNLYQYIKECKKHNVTDIVRVCEPTYSKVDLENAGIKLHEMPYPDGHSPPDEVLDRWLKLVDERFIHPVASTSSPSSSAVMTTSANNSTINGTNHPNGSTNETYPKTTNKPTIAVHCVAGLGRAPVLVAIALIEFCKMEPVDAAEYIRKHRRGAINNTQLQWLEGYRRRYKSAHATSCCVVM